MTIHLATVSVACAPRRLLYLVEISRLTLMFFSAHNLSLRVPLTRIQSTTHAFYPDETHSSIRRVFTPSHAPSSKRHFCGFCGTLISTWNEESRQEADYVRVNMGSLRSSSLELLQDAGFLQASPEHSRSPSSPREKIKTGQKENQKTELAAQSREVQGNPWFEEIIEGSELGRIKRRRGGRVSKDGRERVEWEVVEVGGEEEDTGGTTGKRKLGDVGEDEYEGGDAEMKE